MNKEMKSKGDVMVLKRSWLLRIIALSLIALSSVAVAFAQGGPNRQPQATCQDNVKLCFQQINQQISQARAYVRHVKPGDPVKFNPQPDPPGDPDPWYRNGLAAYKRLQGEFAALSESSPWGRSQWTWSQNKIEAWRKTVSEAQRKLEGLAQSSDRRAANVALNDLSASVQRLSRLVTSRSL
jgi:hypothetical protein